MEAAPILVTGATGAQGGAAIDAFLAARAPVRALVRDPASAAARALAARGVVLATGDFDDADSLERALAGAGGLFSVQLPSSPDDPDREARTGGKLIAAAERAGVRQIVHTSVARAGDHERFTDWQSGRWGQGYWLGKSAVNDRVRASAVPVWTILRPAFLLDNFMAPKAALMFPALARGVLQSAMDADARLDLVAAADVGRLAAAAFAEPQRFHERTIDLAAERLTMAEVAAILARVTGRSVRHEHLSPEAAIAAGHHVGLVESQCWASVEGYRVDLVEARRWGVPLETLADWAGRHRERIAVEAP